MTLHAGAGAQARGDGKGRSRRTARGAVAAVLVAFTAALSGCFSQVGDTASIQLATAYVAAPRSQGPTVAYVVIRNNGPVDELVSARTSVGGRVVFRGPVRPGVLAMRTVHAITVPANSTLSMRPNGYHMLIVGAGRMRGGKDIVLTLVFARAGAVTVVAQVTNPQTGGSSYFLN